MGLRCLGVVRGPTPEVRERPVRPAFAHRGHRGCQPFEERQGPVELDPPAPGCGVHLRCPVGRHQGTVETVDGRERMGKGAQHPHEELPHRHRGTVGFGACHRGACDRLGCPARTVVVNGHLVVDGIRGSTGQPGSVQGGRIRPDRRVQGGSLRVHEPQGRRLDVRPRLLLLAPGSLTVQGLWVRRAVPIASSPMSKKTKKRKARMRRSKANHGKRPNMGRG